MSGTVRHRIRSDGGYEKSYLLYNRLQKSVTPKDEQFLKAPDVQKIVRYMARIGARKYVTDMYRSGIEQEDMVSVASCFALVFSQHYSDKYPNKKEKLNRLMSFIGQKLHYYVVRAGNQKHREWAVTAKEPDVTLVSTPTGERENFHLTVDKFRKITPKQRAKLYKIASNPKADFDIRTLALDLWMALPENKK